MPLQLIFTSAPQGLVAGRSGFCTVARHQAMPERLAQLLESIGTPHGQSTGATFTFRTLEASDKTYYVLSRFVARGLDYTQRDNRLAHHLVFTQEEVAILPPPPALAARWKGWRDEWTAAPEWLAEENKPLALEAYQPLSPATSWRELAGTGAKAAWLVNESGPALAGLVNFPETLQSLRLLAESANLLGKTAWAATFTTDTATTNADGFTWAIGATKGRPIIDLATATALPAPIGPFARQAAMGVTAQKHPSAPQSQQNQPSPKTTGKDSGFNGAILVVLGLVLLAAGLGSYLMLSTSAPPAPEVPVVTTPPAVDMAKADDIMRAGRALNDVNGFLAREDYVSAAKIWMETVAISPSFSEKYTTDNLPRIKGKYAAATVAQLTARLERPGATADPRGTREIADEATEAINVGTQLKVPQDEQWKRLTEIGNRALFIASLDIRPTLVILGEWGSSDTGPNAPSQADFKLGAAAADKIQKFVENSGATTATSISARIRVLPLTAFHQRDTQSKYGSAEIRRTPKSDWIEAQAAPGRQPPILISVGSRSNLITLNFQDHSGAQAEANRLIEIELATGEHFCIALIANLRALPPLNLGLNGLQLDKDTGVVRPAPWAEPAVNAFIWPTGAIGLYPDGHEFPDRDLPSIRATRSLLDTDLLRLENKSGPGTPPFETIAQRRKLFNKLEYILAGAPWTLRTISTRGEAGPSLLEFR